MTDETANPLGAVRHYHLSGLGRAYIWLACATGVSAAAVTVVAASSGHHLLAGAGATLLAVLLVLPSRAMVLSIAMDDGGLTIRRVLRSQRIAWERVRTVVLLVEPGMIQALRNAGHRGFAIPIDGVLVMVEVDGGDVRPVRIREALLAGGREVTLAVRQHVGGQRSRLLPRSPEIAQAVHGWHRRRLWRAARLAGLIALLCLAIAFLGATGEGLTAGLAAALIQVAVVPVCLLAAALCSGRGEPPTTTPDPTAEPPADEASAAPPTSKQFAPTPLGQRRVGLYVQALLLVLAWAAVASAVLHWLMLPVGLALVVLMAQASPVVRGLSLAGEVLAVGTLTGTRWVLWEQARRVADVGGGVLLRVPGGALGRHLLVLPDLLEGGEAAVSEMQERLGQAEAPDGPLGDGLGLRLWLAQREKAVLGVVAAGSAVGALGTLWALFTGPSSVAVVATCVFLVGLLVLQRLSRRDMQRRSSEFVRWRERDDTDGTETPEVGEVPRLFQ